MREQVWQKQAFLTQSCMSFFCKKEHKYKASALAGETAVSVEFSHKEQREHERDTEIDWVYSQETEGERERDRDCWDCFVFIDDFGIFSV